jgi:2-iminobutanoate/2-iminopropanoate deaminase
MQKINTDKAPRAGGHYSQAIESGGFIFISGQLPIEPVTGEKILGSIEEQTLRVLKNIEAIAVAAGSDLNHIIKTTVYVSDIALWSRVNAVYAQFFGEHKPARAVVPVNTLHFGFQIEIEAIALKP